MHSYTHPPKHRYCGWMFLKRVMQEEKTKRLQDITSYLPYTRFLHECLCVWKSCKCDNQLRGSRENARMRLCVFVYIYYTLYPSMTPFFWAWGTGDHVSRILVELTASAVTFTGDPDGTRQHTHTHVHTQSSVLLYSLNQSSILSQSSPLPPSLCPSIFPSLK